MLSSHVLLGFYVFTYFQNLRLQFCMISQLLPAWCILLLPYFIVKIYLARSTHLKWKCIRLPVITVLSVPNNFLCIASQSFWLQIQRSRVRFPTPRNFLRSRGFGTESTQPHEDNWGATWLKKERIRSRKTEINGCGNSLRWLCNTLYPQMLALISPTSGGRWVGIVRLRTMATEFSLLFSFIASVVKHFQPMFMFFLSIQIPICRYTSTCKTTDYILIFRF
jgi:hypothetical protein